MEGKDIIIIEDLIIGLNIFIIDILNIIIIKEEMEKDIMKIMDTEKMEMMVMEEMGTTEIIIIMMMLMMIISVNLIELKVPSSYKYKDF